MFLAMLFKNMFIYYIIFHMKTTCTSKSANKETLADRMKRYEAVTTSYSLIERLPVYARIDGRAFHTFTHGLDKPFDEDMTNVMKKTCAMLVEKTGAKIGYVQSDEISLCWEDTSKVPFETRLFKLESVLAAMATSFFTIYGLETKMADRIKKMMPHFDCRVCQLPNMSELANMFLFREMDCQKNSITLVALSKFSHKKLQNKNGLDKINMLKNEFGIDYLKDIPEDLRLGSYFRRELYDKILTDEEMAKIPVKHRILDDNGNVVATRSRIVQFYLGKPLLEIEDKVNTLFG